MATKLDLASLPPFDPISDPTSLSQRWKIWKRRFETYLVAVGVTYDQQKRALLLYQAGAETQEIFEAIPEAGNDYASAMKKLDDYFTPKKNIDYEVFQFRQITQHDGETIDQFVTRLRKLAVHCEFADIDRELRSMIIQNCKSKHLRRYALREDDLTLEKLLAKARALEESERLASGMEQSSNYESARLIKHQQFKSKTKVTQSMKPKVSLYECTRCGKTHNKGMCPAKGKQCHKCLKFNHFAKMCRGNNKTRNKLQPSRIRKISEKLTPSSSEEEYVYTLGDNTGKVPEVMVKINGVPIKVTIDTGASINIIDESALMTINKRKQVTLRNSSTRICAYGSQSCLKVLGQFDAQVQTKDSSINATIHVLQGTNGSLMSYITARELGLIKVNVCAMNIKQLTEQYAEVFEGVGKLKDYEVMLHIDESVTPVAQPARRIPFHMRKQVEIELERLEKQDIIKKVDGHTPWISPLVIIPKKNGEVRLCIDMRMANRAILRERYPSPTVDDLMHSLNGATVFSKLDLRSGYHQLSLAYKSRYITTFATHKGLRRYKRLNFGTNSASEIFQNAINEQVRDIQGVINISDDIIVFGETQEKHDEALEAVFRRLLSVGLTVNKEKCEFNKKSLEFFGFVFSRKGISPDPRKVKTIQEAKPPSSTTEVRSFIGMATYCAKFIPNFSDITKLLRELTKKNVNFKWTEKERESFEQVKQMLTSDTVMAYFDGTKQTELTTDASPWGLSAILSQKTPGTGDRRIVAYVSRSLSATEQKYSQTEKEALAIVWASDYTYTCLVVISH